MGASTGLLLIENYSAVSTKRKGFSVSETKPKKSKALPEILGIQSTHFTAGKTET